MKPRKNFLPTIEATRHAVSMCKHIPVPEKREVLAKIQEWETRCLEASGWDAAQEKMFYKCAYSALKRYMNKTTAAGKKARSICLAALYQTAKEDLRKTNKLNVRERDKLLAMCELAMEEWRKVEHTPAGAYKTNVRKNAIKTLRNAIQRAEEGLNKIRADKAFSRI